jgi:lysophospholipase L1-like esterase
MTDKKIQRNRMFYVVLIIAAAILAVCEIGARTWLGFIASPEQRQKYALYSEMSTDEFPWTKHHYLNYYPTPNYKLRSTLHNSLGYRGPEFSLQKPDSVYRIAVLGGSTTYSVKIEDNEKTFTAQLEKLLKSKYGYENVEVINAGVGGYNSWEVLMNLEFRVLDIEPDLVIIYAGGDDVHARLVSPESYRGDNGGRRRNWEPPSGRFFEQSCFIRIISRLLKITHPVNIQFFVTAPTYKGACAPDYDQNASGHRYRELLHENPPVYFKRNLLSMAAVADINDIKIVLATWAYSPYFSGYASTPHYQKGFAENNRAMKEAAASSQVPLFDFADLMPVEKRYWSDGRHVNEEGSVLKADLFAQYIHDAGFITH